MGDKAIASVVESNVGAPGRSPVIRLFYVVQSLTEGPAKKYAGTKWAVREDDLPAVRAKIAAGGPGCRLFTIDISNHDISNPDDQFAKLWNEPSERDAIRAKFVAGLVTDWQGREYDAAGLAEGGMHAFWRHIVQVCQTSYPEIKTGDLPPEVDLALGRACETAVREWLAINVPKAPPASAATELRVVMRLPKKGERMWWVSARTAEDALAEVLRESEELGFPAHADVTPDMSPDKEGLIAVVIEIDGHAPERGPWLRALSQRELMEAQGFKVKS